MDECEHAYPSQRVPEPEYVNGATAPGTARPMVHELRCPVCGEVHGSETDGRVTWSRRA
jgi:hypothetical protein